MNIPSLKTIRQWLPMIGGAAFTLWTAFLVALSLFPASKEPMRPAKPPTPTKGEEPGCVTMPDGLSICDDVPGKGG